MKRNLLSYILIASLSCSTLISPIPAASKGNERPSFSPSNNSSKSDKAISDRPEKGNPSSSSERGNSSSNSSSNGGNSGNNSSSEKVHTKNIAPTQPKKLIPIEQERVLVYFKGNPNRELISNKGGQIHRGLRRSPVISASIPKDTMNDLQNHPDIAYIEPDIEVKANDQVWDWGLEQVQSSQESSSYLTGKGIKVAVLDTGVSTSHEDLQVAGGASFVEYTSSYEDDHGHGTHVAGIIAALDNHFGIRGVAPDSMIYSVKVLDQNGAGYLSSILAGIEWAMDQKMDIINLSLGTASHSSILQQVVDQAYQKGSLVVAAAGNNGSTIEYPAKYSSVIAVGATDPLRNRASFSATGSELEIVAPGVDILSTATNNSYAKMSGTSMATPFVAGNLALLKQMNPDASAAELREKLQNLVIDLGSEGKDSTFGYGFTLSPSEEGQVTQTDLPESTEEKDSKKKNLLGIERAIHHLQTKVEHSKQPTHIEEIILKLTAIKQRVEDQDDVQAGELLESLTHSYEKAGLTQEAILTQQEAVKQDLHNLNGYKTLARLIQKEGNTGIKAFVNGTFTPFDVAPIIDAGRTIVPFRTISEALQAKVEWNEQERSVKVMQNDNEIILWIGKKIALVNGKEVLMDVPAQMKGGRTLVPVRFISESLGAHVQWEAETRSVVIVES